MVADMSDSLPLESSTAKRPRTNWRQLVIIILAFGIIFGLLQFRRLVDPHFKMRATVIFVICFAGVLALWIIRSARFGRLVRVTLLTLVGVCIPLAKDVAAVLIKFGNRTVHFVHPVYAAHYKLPALEIATGPGLRPVDLSHIGDADWPQFLGPDRRNAATGAHLDTDWEKHPPKELWRRDIGPACSSIAIVNGFAITMEQRREAELTVCYELDTGKPRWVHPNIHVEYANGDINGPRATPTVSGGRVYTMGATGTLDCLEGSTGKLLWTRDTLKDANAENLSWGKTCSPLVVDGLVVVSGGSKPPAVLAYHVADGSPAWTAGDDAADYSSPQFGVLNGTRQVINVNKNSVTGIALDGRLLWRFDWEPTDAKAPQPLILDGDRLFVCADYGLGGIMLKIKPTPDGKYEPAVLFRSPKPKSKFANLCVRDHYLYGLDDVNLVCVDLNTGKRLWYGESFGFGQLLLVDDLLLVLTENGELAMVQASPDAFKERGRFQAITGSCQTEPAISGHRIVIRNMNQIVCWDLPTVPQTASR